MFLVIFLSLGFFIELFAQTVLDKNWNYSKISNPNWNIENLHEIPNFPSLVWSKVELYHNAPKEEIFLLKIDLPKISLQNPALYIPKTAFSVKVFCNEQKIYEFSDPTQFQPDKFLGWIFHIIPLNMECLKKENFYFLLYTEYPIRFPVPYIDEKANIVTDIFIKNFSVIVVLAISFSLSLFFFLFFLLRKFDKFFLNLSLFFLTTGIWLFNTNPVSQFLLPIETWRLKLEYFSLYIAPIFAVSYFENVLNSSLIRKLSFTKYLIVLFTLSSFTLDALELFPLWRTLFPFNIILVTLSIFYVIVIIYEIFQKEWEARILGLGLIALTLFAIHDSLQVLGFLPFDPLLMHWGLLSLFFSMSAVVGYKFYLMNWHLKAQTEELSHKNKILRLLNEEKDELNRTLEIKVVERTQDLFQKMEDLQKLKTQQDADYYLTCALLIPLIRKTNSFSKFKIESYIKQYKSFEFRAKRWELGGDIIIVEKINLLHEDFLFFFSGDAMGKSMQGAGGAIVAGTVVNHIINRNKKFHIHQSVKDWLITFYEELNSIFLTFEGYMLFTSCFGLLDKEGKIVWINASHPETILYSNNQAGYMKNEKVSNEFGSNKTPQVYLNEIELKEGEKIFIGSDGKDDIQLKTSDRTNLSEMEDFFLKTINACNGDFNQIIQIYNTEVMLWDDLSLLCIES